MSKEIAIAAWRSFLGRVPADESDLDGYAALSPEKLAEMFLNCEEFKTGVSLGRSTALRSTAAFLRAIEPHAMAADFYHPRHLSRTPDADKRILLIGACFVEAWIKKADPGMTVDLILFNNAANIGDQIPRDITDYAYAVVQPPLRLIMSEVETIKLLYEGDAMFEDIAARALHMLDLTLAEMTGPIPDIPVFVANYMMPQRNPVGTLIDEDAIGLWSLMRRINDHVAGWARNRPNTFVLDVDRLAAGFGRRFVQDDPFTFQSHGALVGDIDMLMDGERLIPSTPLSSRYRFDTASFIKLIWAELESSSRILRGLDQVKMVCMDIDDTMWRGVQAEGHDPTRHPIEGWPIGLQEALAVLRRRGIILAIVSKNDAAVIAELWPRMFGPRLPLEAFAIRKIDWGDKAHNLAEAIAEANVHPDSVIFIDDNPVEREAVRRALPEVRVVDAPHNDWRRILLWSSETQVPVITGESARRNETIAAAVARKQVMTGLSREQFLTDLAVEVAIQPIGSTDNEDFARAFELLNKTNQFNTNGRRWTPGEAAAHFRDGGIWWALRVRDRLISYGLVGVAILRGARVEQMVLSCRTFGLDVELALLSVAIDQALAEHPVATAGIVVTDRNAPARGVFERAGWHKAGDEWWTRDALAFPTHIRQVDRFA